MLVRGTGERGQTLPLWTLSIAATLTLLFFMTNYTNTLRWQIRAQNAADSAAAAGISTDANMYNERTTLQYAAAVEETRMRYLLQALVNVVNDPSHCGSSSACDADYVKLMTAYNLAQTKYAQIITSMQTAQTNAQGGLPNASKAVALASTNCAVFDCAFTYTSKINSSTETVDVIACKKVAVLSPLLLGQASNATFTAIGHSLAGLSPVNETFTPSTVNPGTGVAYQPDESPAGAGVAAEYGVSFKNLSVNMIWYVAGNVRPAAAVAGYGCS